MREKTIHVAVGLHDREGTYCRHLGALLVSIFMNTTHSVQVHLLHDATLTSENRAYFVYLGKKFQQEILFHDIDAVFALEASETLCLNTVGTLFRLLLPGLVDVIGILAIRGLVYDNPYH